MSDRKSITVPLPGGMALPSSAELGKNEWFPSYTPENVAAADADFVEEHARYLRARADQARAAVALIEARFELGRAIARLGALRDIARDEFILGHTTRQHQQRMADLVHLTAELQAQAKMLEAKHRRDALIPKPAPAAPPQLPSPGLSPSELGEILSAMPELSPDLRATLGKIFEAALDEKGKR